MYENLEFAREVEPCEDAGRSCRGHVLGTRSRGMSRRYDQDLTRSNSQSQFFINLSLLLLYQLIKMVIKSLSMYCKIEVG